jgi:integrase
MSRGKFHAKAFTRPGSKKYFADVKDADGNRIKRALCLLVKDSPIDKAQSLAEEIQEAFRNLEGSLNVFFSARFLRDQGFLSEDLLKQYFSSTSSDLRLLPTIKDLFEEHPTTVEEMLYYSHRYKTHTKYLQRYIDLYGEGVECLTVANVEKWVKVLEGMGFRKATVKHHLNTVKRVSRRLPHHEKTDILFRVRFALRDEVEKKIETFTMKELIKILEKLQEDQDRRFVVGLSLGCVMGLRISEIARARIEDLNEDCSVLSIGCQVVDGKRQVKRAASIRSLPIPKTLRVWIRELVGDRPEGPLIASRSVSNHKGGKMHPHNVSKLLTAKIKEVAPRYIQPGDLRAVCSTLMIYGGVDSRLLESWLGHSVSGISAVTSKHYLAKIEIRKLKEVAKFWEKRLKKMKQADPIGTLKPPNRDT